MAAAAGDIVFLVYDEAPDLYHSRLLTGHVEGSSWIVVTPTFDVFEEDISLTNPYLIAVRFGRGLGIPPYGVRLDMLYEFNPPPSPKLRSLRSSPRARGWRCWRDRREGWLRCRRFPPVPPVAPPAPPAGAVVPPAAAVPAAAAAMAAPAPAAAGAGAALLPYDGPVPDALGTPPVGYTWVVADEQPGDGRALGDVVDVGPGPLQATLLSQKGKKGLLELPGGDVVFAVIMHPRR